MPKVSVIIPNYNHALYLQERIDSVLNQTFQDFEVIILDDCSPDKSREIIEQYREHPKVNHIIYNEKNSGSTFKQWEKGIELAIGKYIWIAESDDWCENSFLENIIPELEKKESCVIGYCQSYCIIGENKISFQSNHPQLREHIDGRTFLKEYSLRHPIFNASMAVWKKEAFFKVSKDFTNYKFCGDWLFWIELCRHGDVFVSGKLLNYFRKHDKDVSGKAFKSGLNFIEELNMLNSLVEKKVIDRDLYLSSLKNTYNRFKEGKDGYGKQTTNLLYNLFYTFPDIKKKLQIHYFKKHTKTVLRESLKRFFGFFSYL